MLINNFVASKPCSTYFENNLSEVFISAMKWFLIRFGSKTHQTRVVWRLKILLQFINKTYQNFFPGVALIKVKFSTKKFSV